MCRHEIYLLLIHNPFIHPTQAFVQFHPTSAHFSNSGLDIIIYSTNSGLDIKIYSTNSGLDIKMFSTNSGSNIKIYFLQIQI